MLTSCLIIVSAACFMEIRQWWLEKPTTFFRRVGVRWLDGAVAPWTGFEEILQTFHNYVAFYYPEQRLTAFKDLWIDVSPVEPSHLETIPLCFGLTVKQRIVLQQVSSLRNAYHSALFDLLALHLLHVLRHNRYDENATVIAHDLIKFHIQSTLKP